MLKRTFPTRTPIIKKPSRNPMMLECSLSLSVINPIAVKTEILISANEIPTTQNNILKYQKASASGIRKHMMLTRANAISIDLFSPILGRKDARRKEQIAIGKSLKPSKILASDFEMPKFCCT